MITTKCNYIAVGALFLISTTAYLVGNQMLVDSIRAGGDYTLSSGFWMGAALEIVNSLTVLGIGSFLAAEIRRKNDGLANLYFGSRVIEAVLLLVGMSLPALLLIFNPELVDVSVGIQMHDLVFQLAMISLSFGSFGLCVALLQNQIVPRYLTAVGFVGYFCLLVSAGMGLTGAPAIEWLYIPGAIFELVFPIWLLIKGFRMRTE